jgi:hypothetical protein
VSDPLPASMGWDVFDRHLPDIKTAVAAIRAMPSRRRRPWTLTRVIEKRTHELLAEVFTTTWGPVVAFTDAEHGGTSTNVRSNSDRDSMAPLTGDPNQEFIIEGRSQSYVTWGVHFATRTYPDGLLKFR